MPVAALLALSDSAKELLLVGFIVLVPTVPVAFFAWNFIGSHRNRRSMGEEREIEAGRSLRLTNCCWRAPYSCRRAMAGSRR